LRSAAEGAKMDPMANIHQQFQIKDIEKRCEELPCTRGMKVRARGAAFTLYREVTIGDGPPQPDDRLRLTQVTVHRYEISVLLHNGRWERTGMVGTLDEVFPVIESTMQHVVRDWSMPAAETPSSGTGIRKRKGS
jgi:hypothetical protein